MARKYVRFSASIRPEQKEALEKYAESEELFNQYGEPAMNKALRAILDKNLVMQHYMTFLKAHQLGGSDESSS